MAAQAEPMASRFLEILRGCQSDEADAYINDVLQPEMLHSCSKSELISLVECCADMQSLLREKYTSAVGFFCLRLIEALARTRCESWAAMIASLKLLEGTVLLCMTAKHERPHVCSVLQLLLKGRFLPRSCQARLEGAMMSLSENVIRSLCVEDQVPKQAGFEALEKELVEHARLQRLSSSMEAQRLRVFELFDKVINECFGIHGRQFGSAVNGFQTCSSDIDIMVLLPTTVQDQLIAEAFRKRDEGPEALEENFAEGAGASSLPASDWSFLSSRRKPRVASVAASRNLAVCLRNAGLHVCEVIEAARVPLVKCKHTILPSPSDDQAEVEPIEFEVDISFCNQVAWFNSHLLRTYAEFDDRAVQLGVLVKLWAKRRKINSAFEGTLSSYSYVLMVIHYLQQKGILPNLQRPREKVMEDLCIESIERILEGGHNVWYVDPFQTAAADVDSPFAIAGACPSASSSAPSPTERTKGWWIGTVPPRAGILELFYGFLRYFAMEFNSYADVVSIRWRDPMVPWKMDYFRANAEEEEGSEAGEEDMPVEVEEAAQEDPSPSAVQSQDHEVLEPAQSPSLMAIAYPEDTEGAEPERSSSALLSTVSGDEAEDFAPVLDQACSVQNEDESHLVDSETISHPVDSDGVSHHVDSDAIPPPRSPVKSPSGGLDIAGKTYAPLPEVLIGTVRTYKPEAGYGFINCQAINQKYGRDVFLHQRQAAGLSVGDRVSFMVELNHKGNPQARQINKVASDEVETVLQEIEIATTNNPNDRRGSQGEIRAAQRALLAEKRLKNRQCLCIDDPMELNRTLGVTFSGQEVIAYEMRRALSILKKGGDGAIESLFKEKDVKAGKKQWQTREYSPTPSQTLQMNGRNELKQFVEVERPLRKGVVGWIIGSQGATIQKIKESSGCTDVHVNDTKSGACLYLRGEPKNVRAALEQAEKTMAKQRMRSAKPTTDVPAPIGDRKSTSYYDRQLEQRVVHPPPQPPPKKPPQTPTSFVPPNTPPVAAEFAASIARQPRASDGKAMSLSVSPPRSVKLATTPTPSSPNGAISLMEMLQTSPGEENHSSMVPPLPSATMMRDPGQPGIATPPAHDGVSAPPPPKVSRWRPPPPQTHLEHSPAKPAVTTVHMLEARLLAEAQDAENVSSKPRSNDGDFSGGDNHSARWTNLAETPLQPWHSTSRDASSRGPQDVQEGPLKNIISRFSSPLNDAPVRPPRGTTSEFSGAYLATVPTIAHATAIVPPAAPQVPAVEPSREAELADRRKKGTKIRMQN